jgi:hypothetical protein
MNSGVAVWLLPSVLILLLATLLAGCGTSTTTQQTNTSSTPAVTATLAPSPTATTTVGPCPNKVMGTATVPPAPAPTPIAAANWTTYTNTSSHYSIQYPASWYVPDTSPTSSNFYLLNFDPRTYHPGGDNLPPPPYTKIEIHSLQTSAGKTPMEFYTANDTNNPLNPPECSRTVTQTTIGGHTALQIVQWPAASGYGPPTTYPQVHYYVATGNGQPLLGLFEYYSPNGQPSPTFAHMIAGLAFTG